MNTKALSSLLALGLILLGFQNCGNFTAQNQLMNSSDLASVDTDVRDMEKRGDIDQLYYYYGLNKDSSPSTKADIKNQYVDALFDLKNKKVDLKFKIKEEWSEIKKSIALTDKDVETIKDALKKIKLEKESHIDDLKGHAEEYIITYLSDQTSYLAQLQTLKDQFDGLSIKDGQTLLTQTLNEILARKLDLSLLKKFTQLIEDKAELKDLVSRIKNFFKNLKISIENSGTLTIKINAGSFQSEVIKEI